MRNKKVSPVKLAVHKLILKKFAEEQAKGEANIEWLAARINRDARYVRKVIANPRHLTIDCASDLLLALKCELVFYDQ